MNGTMGMIAATSKIAPQPCRCGGCSSTRVVCFACSVCGRGPFPLTRESDHFRRNFSYVGSVRGFQLHACSPLCRLLLEAYVPAPSDLVDPAMAPVAAA